MKYKKLKFPRDEQAHKNIIEWWYFNGNLEDSKGNDYAFMNCLFKADIKKVKIAFLKSPFKTSYFSHSLLSDIKNKKFYPEVNPLSLISTDSFSKPFLFINYASPSLKGYTNCVIESLGKGIYHLKTRDVDLVLSSVKKPLLEGGKGFINLDPEKTYYYSLTNLKTKGKIKIKGKWIAVKGKSWMDHQWADVPYDRDKAKWTWFSVQLQNNMELVCFEYDNSLKKTYLASISYPDNRQKTFSDIKFKPLGKNWKSKKTGTIYPLSWEIQIPEAKLSLDVDALVDDQEINFGTINYFEGPLKVRGKLDGKTVAGKGFMELAGYPSNYTKMKFLRDEFNMALDKSLAYAKKRLISR